MLKVALIDDEINDLLKVSENLIALDPHAERIKVFPLLLSSDTKESVEKQTAWWQKDVRAALAAKNVFDIVFPTLPPPLGPLDVTKQEECATLLDFIAGLDADVLVSDSSMKEEYAGIELLETALSDPRWAGNNWQCWLMTKWPRIAKTIQDSRFRWRGKFDPLARYIDKNEIIRSAGSGVCYHALKERVIDLAIERKDAGHKVKGVTRFGRLVGQSPFMNGPGGVYESIEASTRDPNVTILISGDNGTGKELIAREIHERSGKKGEFIAESCANFPEHLMGSTLFGHEKGAFTGAYERKPGLFELAANGTLFLDEIGELPFDQQSKLLRVLEEREFYRVGGKSKIKVENVRVISATNQPIIEMIKEGRFRSDLYYRLCVVPIKVPSLKERPEDIPLLTDHFVDHFNEQMGRNLSITENARAALQSHAWPGNVRELRNCIQRIFIFAREDYISEEGVLNAIDKSETVGDQPQHPTPSDGAQASPISLNDCYDKEAPEIWQHILDGRLVMELSQLKPLGLKKVVQIADLADAWAREKYNRAHPPNHECLRLFNMKNNAYKQRVRAYRKELEQLQS